MNIIFVKFFFILLLNFLQAQIIDSMEMIKPNQNFYSQENCLLFESNESDINKITSTNFAYIQKAFQITAFDNGKLIKLLFFNSIQFQNQLVFGICQFLNKNQSYFIVCIDGVQFNHNYTLIQYQKNYKTIKIEITSQNQTLCTDMIIDENNQIFSYCQNPNNFQIHKINLKNQTSITMLNHDQNIQNCSQKFFNFNSILYLALYNCENWTIFNVTNNLITILNNEIISNLINIEPNIKIGFINQIYICSKLIQNYQEQSFVFLVEFNKYYLFDIYQNEILFTNFQIFQRKIIKLQISENCIINYAVVESEIEDLQHIKFNYTNKEISIKKNLWQNVLALKQYLIIQRSSELQIILSQFLSETYNIMPYEIQLIDVIKDSREKILIYLPNFLYQINYKENLIQFYEYQDNPRFIKPTLNFIYLFEGFSFIKDLTQAQIIKYILIYNTPEQIINYMLSNPLKILILYNCNQIVTFKIQQDLSQYLIEVEQKAFITGNSKIISIEDNIAFSRFCEIKEVVSQIKKIIWMNDLDISNQTTLAFQNQNNQLVFYYQKQLKQLQFSMNQYEVVNHSGFLLVFEKNKKQITSINLIIFLFQKPFTLNDNIKEFKPCIDQVIFQLENDEIVIYNLISSKFVYLQNEFKQFGLPIFYHYSNLFTIIQYEQFLIILSKSSQYYKYRIENVTIFNIEQNFQFFKIKSIHNQQNQVLIYTYDGKSLKLENQYLLQNYQLIRPLIYNGNKEYLALATFKDEQKSILIVNVFQYISIIKVISCLDYSFTLIDNLLVYLNNEGILTIFNAKEYLITYKIQNNLYNYFHQQKETIYIEFQTNNKYYTYLQQIDIKIINSCYQLSILQNNQMIVDNIKIKTNQLFFGPSDSILSSNQDQFQISHPITFSYSITDCNTTNSQYCFINFQTLELQKYGKFLFLFKCLFNNNNLIDAIPLYCFNQNISGTFKMFNQINLLNDSILISIIQDYSFFYINFFQIDFKQKLFIEINSFKFFQESNFNVFKYDIIYKNQIILLIQKSSQARNLLIYVKENQCKLYENFSGILNIFCINQLEDIYLIISDTFDQHRYFISFQKISFNLFNYKIIKSINLHQELVDYIQKTIQMNSQYNLIDPNFFNYLKNFYSCIQDDQNLLVCKLFIIIKQISCDIQITINFEQQSFNFELLRLIRNPLNKQRLELQYIDQSIIIISSGDEKSYIYETSSNQSMYDYTSKIELFQYQIFQIDTNQYFFVDYEQQDFYIGEIGYKIKLLNQSNQEKEYLIISNSLSEIKIEVNFQQANNISQQKYFIYLVCISLIILLLCFYIQRRSKLKKIKQQRIMQNIN